MRAAIMYADDDEAPEIIAIECATCRAFVDEQAVYKNDMGDEICEDCAGELYWAQHHWDRWKHGRE